MATGSGALGVNLRDGGTSNITPTYQVPNTARLYEQMGDALANLAAPVQDAIDRRAARAGKKAGLDAASQVSADVEAGKDPAKLKTPRFNPLNHGAYEAAFNAATAAKLRSDIDNHDDVLRGQHRYDPQGYKDASAKALSGFIQGAPEEMAVDIEAYGSAKFAGGYATISKVAEERASQEAAADVATRIKTLDDRMLGLASNGSLSSDDFVRTDAERSLLQIERERNPAILYSDGQRAYDDDKLYDSLHGAAAAYSATQAYGEAGGGLPGRAAAYRHLDDEVLNGEAFADIAPDRRHRIYLDAKKQIEDFSHADVEQRREQEAAEREKRAEAREAVGSLRLGIMLGGVSESEIKARDDIPDSDKASLIAGARAQARRERAEARSATALERAGRVASYREFSDAAAAGTLSEGEIADAVHAGQLTSGQARTLAAKRDKSLSPIVGDVMAPVKDASNRPGRRPSAEKQALAEEQATIWARQNPNATLDDRLKQGKAIAERVYGPQKTAPGPAAGGGSSRKGKIDAAKAQFSAGKINRVEYNRRLKEAMGG